MWSIIINIILSYRPCDLSIMCHAVLCCSWNFFCPNDFDFLPFRKNFFSSSALSFCPALTVISSILRLSQNVAGVTLLALGNGAPDIFSAFAAVNQDEDEKASLAVGALFGKQAYCTSRPIHLIDKNRCWYFCDHNCGWSCDNCQAIYADSAPLPSWYYLLYLCCVLDLLPSLV